MTSKNSFWASLKENNKRRTWLWAVSWLFSLLYYVVGCALITSSQKSYMVRLAEVQQLTPEEMHTWMLHVVANLLGSDVILCLAAAAFAVLTAVQGFAYLYHKRQVDLYHSLPVTKSSRFVVIWLNGILIYLIPNLTGLVLGILVAAAQGAMSGALLNMLLIKFIFVLILFLSIYHLNLIAVMLTGHVVITLFGMAVLHSYEFVVRFLTEAYMGLFFEKYSHTHSYIEKMWLTPIWYYLTAWKAFAGWKQTDWANALIPMTLLLLLLVILFLAIAYLLYRKRPAEAAGRAMTFGITKRVIKIAIVIPATLMLACMIESMTAVSVYGEDPGHGNPFFIALAVVIGAVLSSSLVEVIYEFDIKACLRKKKDILIGGGLAALLFLGFRYDVIGYDDYIPKAPDVESYALVMQDPYWQTYFDENGRRENTEPYIIRNMFLTDADAICKLAAMQPESMSEAEESVTVVYRLDSGRIVDRQIWLDYDLPETDVLLNRIVGSLEYKKGAYMVMADYFDQWLMADDTGRMYAEWSMRPYSFRIPEEAWPDLLAAYRRDLEFIDYMDISRGLPAGTILFSENDEGRTYFSSYDYSSSKVTHSEMTVYEDCTQTIACLKELGIYKDGPLVIEDVERIEVVNFNLTPKEAEEHPWEANPGSDNYYYRYGIYGETVDMATEEMSDKTVTASYTTAGEIQEISPALYGATDSWRYQPGKRYQEVLEPSYQVNVYFKTGTIPYEDHIQSHIYMVRKGMLPNFMRDATLFIGDE